MFATLPFILLLILQGFARQDCAELLGGNQDFANIPAQARSLKAFDRLFVHLSLGGSDQKSRCAEPCENAAENRKDFVRTSFDGSGKLLSGFLSIQRSRDGPVA